MLTAIEKIEALEIPAVSFLTEADKRFCESLFDAYGKHLAHMDKLSEFIRQEQGNHLHQVPKEQMYFSRTLDKIYKLTEQLEEIKDGLTNAFVNKIEGHFTSHYTLAFKSMNPENDHQHLPPFSTYHAIVENIANQTGTDFLEAGKRQIIKRFRDFISVKHPPELHHNKISLHAYCILEEHYDNRISINEYKDKTKCMLHALNLYFNGGTQLPVELDNRLQQWIHDLNITTAEKLLPALSTRFFKNGRIDFLFTNGQSALDFWNYYNLGNIERS